MPTLFGTKTDPDHYIETNRKPEPLLKNHTQFAKPLAYKQLDSERKIKERVKTRKTIE